MLNFYRNRPRNADQQDLQKHIVDFKAASIVFTGLGLGGAVGLLASGHPVMAAGAAAKVAANQYAIYRYYRDGMRAERAEETRLEELSYAESSFS